MTRKVQIINIGDSLGIELPAEIAERIMAENREHLSRLAPQGDWSIPSTPIP